MRTACDSYMSIRGSPILIHVGQPSIPQVPSDAPGWAALDTAHIKRTNGKTAIIITLMGDIVVLKAETLMLGSGALVSPIDHTSDPITNVRDNGCCVYTRCPVRDSSAFVEYTVSNRGIRAGWTQWNRMYPNRWATVCTAVQWHKSVETTPPPPPRMTLQSFYRYRNEFPVVST